MANQASHRRINPWPSSFGPALPAPVGAKSPAVPADHGGRLDENEGPAPSRPDAPEPDPEDSIAVLQAHRPLLSLKDHQLLSEGQVLERQAPPTPQPRYEGPYRHQEIGIRLALSADPSSVRRMVVGDGVRVCGLGSSVGLAGALGASQLLSGVLPGLRAWDLAAFLCAVSVSIGVALLAIVIPARAATRVDPLEAMRRVSG